MSWIPFSWAAQPGPVELWAVLGGRLTLARDTGGFSHLLDFAWWFLSLEESDQAFRSPLPRRMFAKELQPVKALSTLEGGNSINFLAYLEQNTSSIFITEQTLKFLAGLTQTLRLSLPVLTSVT